MLDWDSMYISGRDFGELPGSVIDRILSFDTSSAPRTALDIGCGTGATVRALCARGYEALGIDSSGEAIRLAVSGGQGKFEVFNFENDDISELPEPFKVIVCKHVYAFITDKPAFLRKVSGLVSGDGLFALITPLKESVSTEKQGIAVREQELLKELRTFFTIKYRESLKSGELLVLQPLGG